MTSTVIQFPTHGKTPASAPAFLPRARRDRIAYRAIQTLKQPYSLDADLIDACNDVLTYSRSPVWTRRAKRILANLASPLEV